MTGSQVLEAAWVAAVHTSEGDEQPLGAAVLVDADRLLTCAHVVCDGAGPGGRVRPSLWVGFPKSEAPYHRLRVCSVQVAPRWSAGQRTADVAVVEVAGVLPAGVHPAPLRSPKPTDVVSKQWWAFGFPNFDPLGNDADGTIGALLGFGWVRLDSCSRYHVEPGFSGTALWSPDYQAVVGLVGKANERGDGQAITVQQADGCLPEEKLRALAEWALPAAGDDALAAWGWTLAEDPEAGRHWRPRSRGVSIDSERGYRFRGRHAALTKVTGWLDRPAPDRKVLVVTGSPGVGKSAVLGRIVTTADAGVAAALPADDAAVRARNGSVACAVHAKGKTALDIAVEVARAASAPIPQRPEDLAPALCEALTPDAGPGKGPLRGAFNVVIDALDEAATAAEAAVVIDKVVLPVATTCARVGAQVVVGTRRGVDTIDLTGRFGAGAEVVDLDSDTYFEADDLVDYALATLQLRGDERDDNPYTHQPTALPVARRIAQIADRNFLVAGLIARAHGLHDTRPAAPADLAVTTTVEAALNTYLQRIPARDGIPAQDLLSVLALAEPPGWTARLWATAVTALTAHRPTIAQLRAFARGPAATFLIESTPHTDDPAYRLFHQALADTLHHTRAAIHPRTDDERALTGAFHTLGQTTGWDHAPAYLLRSLPGHATRAHTVDTLLTDDTYLLHADLHRLIPTADHATTPTGRQRSRLLHLTPRAITAGPAERSAMLNLTCALEHLTTPLTPHPRAPYAARWAATRPRTERAVLEGHTSGVRGVCAVPGPDGTTLLASASDDGTVRVWDPATGHPRQFIPVHHEAYALATLDAGTLAIGLSSGLLMLDLRDTNPATTPA